MQPSEPPVNASEDDIEAQRRFHMWRANTSNLLLQARGGSQGGGGENDKDLLDYCHRQAQRLCDILRPFSPSKEKAIVAELDVLIQQSVELDLEISKQIAHLELESVQASLPLAYDPQTMGLEPGQRQMVDHRDQVASLVVSPGLVKRGKSSGDDFGLVTRLLPMEVVCEQRERGSIIDRAAREVANITRRH